MNDQQTRSSVGPLARGGEESWELPPKNRTGAAIPWWAKARIRVGSLRRSFKHDVADILVFLLRRGRVGGGLFPGMRLGFTRDTALATKLVGAYEAEIIPVLGWFRDAGFARLVNVGSAEGYYSIGLARAMPSLHVAAFEGGAVMRARLAHNARRNRVAGRITQYGLATWENLAAVLAPAGPAWLIVDIEGAECELLDPVRVPALQDAWMVVELHPANVPAVLEKLRARFAPTHALWLYPQQTDWRQRRQSGERCVRFHWLARFRHFNAERRGGLSTPWLLLCPRRTPLRPDAEVLHLGQPVGSSGQP